MLLTQYSVGETIDGRTYRIYRHPWRESYGLGAWYLVDEASEEISFLDEPLTSAQVALFFINDPLARA